MAFDVEAIEREHGEKRAELQSLQLRIAEANAPATLARNARIALVVRIAAVVIGSLLGATSVYAHRQLFPHKVTHNMCIPF